MKKIIILIFLFTLNSFCQTVINYNDSGLKKMQLKEYSSAIVDFNKAIKLNPKSSNLYSNRGLAKFKLKDFNGAIQDFDKSIQFEPNESIFYVYKGNCKMEIGNYESAIKDYNFALELEPNNAKTYNYRGFSKAMLKNYNGAIEDYKSAIKINPKYETAFYNKGISEFLSGNKNEACIDFNKSNDLGFTAAGEAYQKYCNLDIKSEDGNLYSKDGVNLGNKMELFKNCVTGFFKESSFKMNNDSDKYSYCECFSTTLAKYFTAAEISEIVSGKIKLEQELSKKGHQELFNDFQKCSQIIINSTDKNSNINATGEKYGDVFLLGCKESLKDSNRYDDINIDLCCECLQEEINSRELNISLKEIKDENSVLFNEIILNCLNRPGVIKNNKSENSINDVRSYLKHEDIPVIIVLSSYKVKLVFNNISKCFIIDSGASDTAISSDFERELILEGIIKKENYISDETYTIADGSEIKCRRVKLNNVRIGNFSINNVIVSITNSKSDLLLGKSFLNKFKKWSINNQNSKLYLERN